MIGVAEVSIVAPSEYLLHLLMVDLVETTQLVLLEPEGDRAFEVANSVVLKWVFVLVLGVSRRIL